MCAIALYAIFRFFNLVWISESDRRAVGTVMKRTKKLKQQPCRERVRKNVAKFHKFFKLKNALIWPVEKETRRLRNCIYI